LRDRVDRWHDVAGPREVPEQAMIAGLIPAADHVTDTEMRQALAERAALIEQRAEAFVARAIASGDRWLTRLGPPPDVPALRLRWERAAATVAAYRDRHGVTDPANPFGEPSGGGHWTRRADRRRAHDAADEARRLTAAARDTQDRRAGEQFQRRYLAPEL
jgi:hypothetical protein